MSAASGAASSRRARASASNGCARPSSATTRCRPPTSRWWQCCAICCEEIAMSDLETLGALNRDYIDSVQGSDVRRFDEILAEDFYCSNPDGSMVDRKGFLDQTARPVAIRNLAARDVKIRLLGDVAIIHARTTYTLPDGREGAGRYTDIWVRRGGARRAVAAHVTRC